MSYSDLQMVIASQIAYMDFNSAAVDSGQYTVKELLEMELESAGGDKREKINRLLNLMEREEGKSCADWVIRDIRNDQKNSGMYACMLETGEKDALVAFRGSEDMSNPEHLQKDWIESDLGLLNSIQTPQQAEAERYIRDLYQKYGSEYDHFGMTGHSLGGNLAEHAAITAPDGMRDKIDRCLNLDGPGMSEMYLTAHANDIRKSKGIIDHYQWSAIGTLLNTVPGTNYQTVKAKTPDDEGALSIVWRHDTKNLDDYFDENGNLIPGDKDWLARHTKEISGLLDHFICMSMGTIGAAILYNFMDMTMDAIQNLYEKFQQSFVQGGMVQFSVQKQALYEASDQIQRASETVKAVQMETESIRKELSMNSLAAGYIKYRLWRTENRMERLAGQIQSCASKGKDCAQVYQRYDGMIAQKY